MTARTRTATSSLHSYLLYPEYGRDELHPRGSSVAGRSLLQVSRILGWVLRRNTALGILLGCLLKHESAIEDSQLYTSWAVSCTSS